MLTRLWKEICAIKLWFVLVIFAGIATLGMAYWFAQKQMPVGAPPKETAIQTLGLLKSTTQNSLNLLVLFYILVFNLAAAKLWGTEFHANSIQRLLTQPLSRNRIWLEKSSVFVLLIFIVALFNFPICSQLGKPVAHWGMLAFASASDPNLIPDPDVSRQYYYHFCLILFCGLTALATAPTLSLWLRQTHTVFWASLVLQIASLIICLTIQRVFNFSVNQFLSNAIEACTSDLIWRFCLELAIWPLIWFAIMYPIGWWKFRQLEV